MTLRLIQSSDAYRLAQALADALRAEHPSSMSVFQTHLIGVSNRGMRTWLSQRLAMHNAICGQVQFPFPADLIFEALGQTAGTDIGRDPWREAALPWALLSALPDVLANRSSDLDPLREYVCDILNVSVDDVASAVAEAPVTPALWALVFQIASLFDDYLAFRPHWAKAWGYGHEVAAIDCPADAPFRTLRRHFGWQQPLWEAVYERLGEPRRLSATHTEPLPPHDQRPIRLFMPTELPPLLQRGLQRLAHTRLVELYLLSYGEHTWERLRAQYPQSEQPTYISRHALESSVLGHIHPFRASCGRGELDTALVSGWLADESIWLRTVSDQNCTSLLQRMQRRIAGDDDQTVTERMALTDDSIQFHACHGPRRQVEVLRDALLHLFERYDGQDGRYPLQPRNILVLVADLTKYAPLIDSVFADGRAKAGVADTWGEVGAPRIEVELVGRSFQHTNPVAEALLSLLDFVSVSERLAASQVLDFFSLAPVMRRFGFESDDLTQLRTWVEAVNIRWGIDGIHRQNMTSPGELPQDAAPHRLVFPPVHVNSWLEGLERLLLGVVLADDDTLFDDEDGDGLIPVDDMEGSARALVGRFADAVTTLIDVVGRLHEPRTVHDWTTVLLGGQDDDDPGCLARMTATPGRLGWLTRHVREALLDFDASASDGLCGQEGPLLNPVTLRTALARSFELRAGYDSTPLSAVTFASLNSHTRLPYDIVALLGFDDDAFPRTPSRQQFDGVALTRQVGDIDGADTDRGRFLDAVMAAQRHLLILYSGRHLRTNHHRPPSVVVGELMDAIDDCVVPVSSSKHSVVAPSEWLTRYHPLQSFSPQNYREHTDGVPRYAGDDGRPWSYRQPIWLYEFEDSTNTAAWDFAADLHDGLAAAPEEGHGETVVELHQLVNFFKNPAQIFLRQRLGMYVEREQEALSDREPVWANHLAMYGIKNQILLGAWQHRELEKPDDAAQARLYASGTLPWGPAGTRSINAAFEAVQVLFGEKGVDRFDVPLPYGSGISSRRFEIPLTVPMSGGDPRRVLLTGSLGPSVGRILLKVFAGGQDAKRRIDAWLSGLCWAATHPTSDSAIWNVFAKKDKGVPTAVTEGYLFRADRLANFESETQGLRPTGTAADWAQARLAEVLGLYLMGQQRPLPFFPQASLKCAEAMSKIQASDHELRTDELDPATFDKLRSALDNVEKEFRGPKKFGSYDLQLPEVKTLFSQYDIVFAGEKRTVFEPEFLRVSKLFWDGAFNASQCRFTQRNLNSWNIKAMAKSDEVTHG